MINETPRPKNFINNKLLAWGLTHIIAVFMLVALIFLPPKPYRKEILFYSGYLAAIFLVLVLVLNPLKAIFPQLQVIKILNKYRRELGVASFSYAFIHFLCFAIKLGSIGKTIPYLVHPFIMPGFLIAFPILIILTLTSNNSSIKKLGFQRWNKLHKKVYWAEFAVFLHIILIGNKLYALIIFIPLFILQFIRKRLTK